MSELNRVLAKLGQSGQLESAGRFTLDGASARRKQAALRMVDPRLLVLKLIQEMVLLGCSSIEIYRQSSHFTLFGAHPEANPTAMLELAREVSARCQDLGLWVVRPGSVDELIPSSLQRPRLRGSGVLVGIEADWVANLWDLVVDHGYFCPVPIRWHGNPVRAMSASFPGGVAGLWPRSARLGERWILPEAEESARLRVPLSGACLPETALRWNQYSYDVLVRQGIEPSCTRPPVEGGGGGCKRRLSSHTCQTALAIPLALKGPSWLVFVKHGITLDPIQLLDDFGCVVVMDGHDLPVDIAGLTARECQGLLDCLAVAREQLFELAQVCLDRLAQLKVSPPPRWSRLWPGARSNPHSSGVLRSLGELRDRLSAPPRPAGRAPIAPSA